jgi:ketosteroid isomerase-like protein
LARRLTRGEDGVNGRTGSEAAVRDAHDALGVAMTRAGLSAAGELLAEDFSHVDERGRMRSRADALAALSELAPSGPDIDLAVRDYSDIAQVTGTRLSARGSAVYFVTIWMRETAGWRALIHQDNVLAGNESPPHAAPQPRPAGAAPPECANPLKTLPYQPTTDAERAIIASFQQLETAVTRNDADRWVDHVADEFVVTRTGQHPTTKTQRAAAMRKLRDVNAETFVAEVASMRLWVRGDAAVMQAQHVMPGNRRPPYRAARLWVQRGGRWQMAMSQQTTMAD